MVHPYAVVGLFLAIALVIGVVPIALAWLLSPKKLNPRKTQVYESGNPTFGEAWIEYKPQYYLYGLAYVVFGVEVALEAVIFLLILGLGLAYVWRKGWLAWM